MSIINKLEQLRACCGSRLTSGLGNAIIEQFSAKDPHLERAVDNALVAATQVRTEFPDLLDMDEAQLIKELQQGYLNFYQADAINPYVALGASGPWIITSKGAVLYDTGGYGMLGLGHAPDVVLEAMNQPHVMANIMTPSVSQMRLMQALRKEIGRSRDSGCPFETFLCLNSGSEAVSIAARISDINAKLMTDSNGRHAGKPIKRLALKGAFHGRTDRPAQYSDSSMPVYKKYLASFRSNDDLITVPANDCEALLAAFRCAEEEGVFVESMFMEPVMGEGNPGMAVTPEFYTLARELTHCHGSLLLVDSIQAGLRANGCISIVDYPGFEKLPAPDMESYSKAINGGQFPLSVLGVSQRATELYQKGLYGNTMTTNPRAMDVAVAVLSNMTEARRSNIIKAGKELIEKFTQLKDELDGPITKVQGTGLLFSVELTGEYKSYGANSTEEYLRTKGIGVIHGGENSLRFTPWFDISSEEIDLLVAATKDALLNGPKC